MTATAKTTMPKGCQFDHRLSFRRLPLGAFGKQDQDYDHDVFNSAGYTLARPHFGLENGVHLKETQTVSYSDAAQQQQNNVKSILFLESVTYRQRRRLVRPSVGFPTVFGSDGGSPAPDFVLYLGRKLEVAQVHVRHRPRLVGDNGPAYLSGALRRYLSSVGMTHTRGAPYHPMTQGKIERWHRSMKNVVKLEHYYSPGELEAAIGNFVDYYNHERYHESLNNVTPADVYYGRHRNVLSERAKIKRLTMQQRRKETQAASAA